MMHTRHLKRALGWRTTFCAAILLTSIATLPALAAPADEPTIPPAEEILRTLKPDHPRLLVGPATFRELPERAANDETLAAWIEKLRAGAQKMLDAEPSRYEIPDGKRLLATSRRVLDRSCTLGLMYRLDGDDRYAQRLWKELEAAAAFKDWNPSHFLDTAEMTHAFAIAYDWLFDYWTDEQRATLREAMISLGLKPALRGYRGESNQGWWVRSHHNWNQVCNGGIAMGALAIAEDEPVLAGEIIHSGLESLRLAMRQFAPDGGWAEGPGYWNYATRYNVAHLAALESALGTDFGFRNYPGFDRTGDFPIHVLGPSGKSFNFADGSDGAILAPHMFLLARWFNQPAYATHQRRLAEPRAEDVLWYSPPQKAEASVDLPLDRHFQGIDIVTTRSAWNDREALFVGFKGGDNKANHSHLDLGSFVFDALGHRWAMDLGGDDYNLPGYFGRQRWTYYRLRAEGHNTLLINPSKAADQDPKAVAPIIRTGAVKSGAFAIADLTAAYAGDADHVQRGIALINDRSQFLMQDEIQTKQPAEVRWLMHTRAHVAVDESGTSAVLKISDRQVHATILEPASAKFEVMAAEPLPTSPNPQGQKANNGIRRLTIHLSDVERQRIVILFTPMRAGANALTAPPKVIPLAEW